MFFIQNGSLKIPLYIQSVQNPVLSTNKRSTFLCCTTIINRENWILLFNYCYMRYICTFPMTKRLSAKFLRISKKKKMKPCVDRCQSSCSDTRTIYDHKKPDAKLHAPIMLFAQFVFMLEFVQSSSLYIAYYSCKNQTNCSEWKRNVPIFVQQFSTNSPDL